MNKQEKQDVLSDIMVELNLLGDRAFNRKDTRDLKLLEVINNRVVYLWGDLDNDN